MNTEVLYNMNNFNSFNNILTIYKKRIVTYKRVTEIDEEHDIESNNGNRKYKVSFNKIKYIPVYGHYFNANNHFIAKRIVKRKIIKDDTSSNFIIIKDEDLVRPYNGGIYVFKSMGDLYETLSKLKKINNNEILIGK